MLTLGQSRCTPPNAWRRRRARRACLSRSSCAFPSARSSRRDVLTICPQTSPDHRLHVVHQPVLHAVSCPSPRARGRPLC